MTVLEELDALKKRALALEDDWEDLVGQTMELLTRVSGGKILRFVLQPNEEDQAAWEGLLEALVLHPSFHGEMLDLVNSEIVQAMGGISASRVAFEALKKNPILPILWDQQRDDILRFARISAIWSMQKVVWDIIEHDDFVKIIHSLHDNLDQIGFPTDPGEYRRWSNSRYVPTVNNFFNVGSERSATSLTAFAMMLSRAFGVALQSPLLLEFLFE